MTQEKAAHTKDAQALYTAIASLKNQEEIRKFLRDVMTIQEIKEVAERWNVARQLDKGQSYRTIASKTGVSTTTIGRIAHWLHDGEGGYQLALDKQK